MQIGPGDRVARRAAREPLQSQAPQHAVEPRFDALHEQDAVVEAQAHIAHAHDPMSGEVDQLRVEHVAREQDHGRRLLEGGPRREDHVVAVEPLHVAPWRPRRRAAATPDDDAGHGRRGTGGRDAEVGQPSDPPSAAPDGRAEARAQQHVSAGLAAGRSAHARKDAIPVGRHPACAS